jgi:DNA/RNA-binding domain of Phe-tRNA-synthetase-like protein
MPEAPIEEGWVVAEVASEFPDLRLRWIDVPGGGGRQSPEPLKERLRVLANRFNGAQALTMRSAPIPLAYRAFFRGIGLDPDATRTPIEAAAFNRLMEGGFTSHDRLSDALLLGLVETSVPLWAVDAESLDGPLGIRESQRGERLGAGPFANDVAPGRLVVADASGIVGVLFGELAKPREPTPSTERLRIFTIQVEGIPELHVEEALWMCEEALDAS